MPYSDKSVFSPDELDSILERASKLKTEELKELTEKVGIYFQDPDPEDLALPEDYLTALDEANDRKMVLKYLQDKGV
jgi:hypothetical protein